MKVSIIMPVYNGELTIQNSIDSVISEKNENDIEFIIVDGKSTDRTMSIVKRNVRYVDKYISEKDNGIHDAINKGIRISSGDFVFVLAADDCLLKGAIKNFYNSIQNDIDIWCGSIIVKKFSSYYFEYSDNNIESLKKSCSLIHPASFIKRESYYRYGFYNEKYKICGDWDLFLRFYKQGAKFQVENVPICVFSTFGISSGDYKNNSSKIFNEEQEILNSTGLSQNEINKITNRRKKKYYRSSNIIIKFFTKLLLNFRLYNCITKIVHKNRRYLNKDELIKYGLV